MGISFGWASGTPSVSVFNGFALPDIFRVSFGVLALFGRFHSFSSGIRVPVPRRSFHSLIAHTRHMGALVSISSPTPCSRRPWTVWCWSALFSCRFFPSNIRFKAVVSQHIRPIGATPASILHGSMVVIGPTWPRPMPRWTESPAQRRCVFVCVLHQSSWRLTHCPICCPVFAVLRVQCAAEAFVMDAALWDFQSAGLGQHPLHCARTHPVCLSGVCPRRFLQTGTC